MTAEEYWSEEWHAGRSIVGLIVQDQVGDTGI